MPILQSVPVISTQLGNPLLVSLVDAGGLANVVVGAGLLGQLPQQQQEISFIALSASGATIFTVSGIVYRASIVLKIAEFDWISAVALAFFPSVTESTNLSLQNAYMRLTYNASGGYWLGIAGLIQGRHFTTVAASFYANGGAPTGRLQVAITKTFVDVFRTHAANHITVTTSLSCATTLTFTGSSSQTQVATFNYTGTWITSPVPQAGFRLFV